MKYKYSLFFIFFSLYIRHVFKYFGPSSCFLFIYGPYFLSYLNFTSKTYLVYILAYKFERGERVAKKKNRERESGRLIIF